MKLQMPPELTKEILEKEYLENGVKFLTKKYKVCKQIIWRWLEENNIERVGRIYKRQDLTNKKFGYLTALKYCHWSEYNTSKSRTLWLCRCDCGNERLVDSFDLIHGRANSCGCKTGEKYFNGVGDLSGTYYNSCHNGAKIRDLEFNVSKEFLWDLYLKQDKKCALTGMPIYLEKKYSSKRSRQTASLDRIDSSKGYTEDNVQWVHKFINFFKGKLDEKELYNICKKIVEKLGVKYENS